jgi:hypothetical protein
MLEVIWIELYDGRATQRLPDRPKYNASFPGPHQFKEYQFRHSCIDVAVAVGAAIYMAELLTDTPQPLTVWRSDYNLKHIVRETLRTFERYCFEEANQPEEDWESLGLTRRERVNSGVHSRQFGVNTVEQFSTRFHAARRCGTAIMRHGINQYPGSGIDRPRQPRETAPSFQLPDLRPGAPPAPIIWEPSDDSEADAPQYALGPDQDDDHLFGLGDPIGFMHPDSDGSNSS